MNSQFCVYIGYEPRELDAYLVARESAYCETCPIILSDMRRNWLYDRKHEVQSDGRLWDVVLSAPMATEFAITRFMTQRMAMRYGHKWALFVDCDMMFRVPAPEILKHADDQFAVMVVKHDHQCVSGTTKMDGQLQLSYPRKNWSSVMLINVDHPAWQRLTIHDINTRRGLELHQLYWLRDEEIGSLPMSWNHLVGVNDPDPNAKLVHFTLGVPSMKGYHDCEHADEWRMWQHLSIM